MRRPLVALVAASADGFIARENGDVRWLDRPRPRDGYQMGRFLEGVDTIVWGRKTWDFGRKHGGAAVFPGARHLVLSGGAPKVEPGVEVVRGPVRALAARLRAERGRGVWLMGGAELFGAFLDAGAVDELVVYVIPVLLGRGIPLFAPRRREVPLRLRDVRRWPDGVVRLRWRVGARG